MAALCAGNPPVFVCAGNCRYPYLCSAGPVRCGHLIVAQDESGTPVGFMGAQENRLEMLFLDPEVRGQGLGARLLCLGMEQYGVSELTVNEQNPAAAGFYRHMGFAVYRRSELDEQGGSYPILYMRRG